MNRYRLRPHLFGGGRADIDRDGKIQLVLPPTLRGYADAQVDDYQGLARSAFPWQAPLTLRLRARASHLSPPGTLGFGFWNDPFGMSLSGAGSVRRLPAAPQALWFFYGSRHNDFSFVDGGQGHGWKAAVLRTTRFPAVILAPGVAAAFVLSRLPLIRKVAVALVRRQAQASEVQLDTVLTDWHEYLITWKEGGVTFQVDGITVSETTVIPHGPLGFVAWIDNQYAVLSAQKGIRFGLLQTDTETSLEIAELKVELG